MHHYQCLKTFKTVMDDAIHSITTDMVRHRLVAHHILTHSVGANFKQPANSNNLWVWHYLCSTLRQISLIHLADRYLQQYQILYMPQMLTC